MCALLAVILVSSPKDMYVPRFSASVRDQLCPRDSTRLRQCVAKMAENLLAQVDPDNLIRVSLDNCQGADVTVDTMIGRVSGPINVPICI
jgi:hypothetical protein